LVRIDVLHNNVGIVEVGGPIETSEESWDRVNVVNLKSMYLKRTQSCRDDEYADGARRRGHRRIRRQRRGDGAPTGRAMSDGADGRCITGTELVVDGGLTVNCV
jgi:hypothetical protein